MKVYFAAPLFNQLETKYNSKVAELLEEKGYKVILPQRDGFEFQDLSQTFKKYLKKELVENAVQDVIYLLDIGKFLFSSDIVVALLNEPIDPGVIVEICYARIMEKYVIGLRSDIRQPFGNYHSRFGGMHFFPGFQCNYFIQYPTNWNYGLEELVKEIDNHIRLFKIRHSKKNKKNLPKEIKYIVDLAEKIFPEGIDMKSEKGLKVIAQQYTKYTKELENIVLVDRIEA